MTRVSRILSLLGVATLTSVYADASPEPEPADVNWVDLAARAPAQVITKCTVPNTVALTFVSSARLYFWTEFNRSNLGRWSISLHVCFPRCLLFFRNLTFPRREVVRQIEAAGGKTTFFVSECSYFSWHLTPN